MRTSWQALRQHVTELPDAGRLAGLYADLQGVAEQQDRSLGFMSSLLAAGALRAGVQIGHTHIFETYRHALGTISAEGLPVYARRVTRPYLAAVRDHFDPARVTYTGRLMQRLRERCPGNQGGTAE
jgi:hypothetical protein